MSSTKILTVGSDPEFFIRHRSTGKIISGIGLIPGAKFAAEDLSGPLGKGFTIQRDNVLAEACVPPVAANEGHLMHENITKFINFTNDNILKVFGDYELAVIASHTMDSSELTSPEALEFGCTESINAWSGDINPKPETSDPNFRSAGGHLHFGYTDFSMFKSYHFIKLCDLFLGLPSLFRDKDVERRKLYGKAGECRLTTFGVEYRVLSNYWVGNEAETTFIFNQLKKIEDNFDMEFDPELELNIQLAINTNNITLAQEICAKYNVLEETVSI